MKAPPTHFRRLRFGTFEADLTAQKLWKRGSPIHLQEKPFQFLALLLERAGDVVTREELRLRLWEADTFVQFDEGLNAAVAKLRYALRDSAETPIFIETIRGTGYRWISPIEHLEKAQEELAETSPAKEPQKEDSLAEVGGSGAVGRTTARIGLVVLVGTVLLLIGVAYFRGVIRQPMPVAEVNQRQLTTNSTDNPVSANAISPDGKYLAYADRKGLHVKLLATGDVRDIPNPPPFENTYVEWGIPQNWFPDGTQFLANTNLPYQPVSAWVVSVLAGAPRKLRDDAAPWSVSAEGNIAFTAQSDRVGDREIWVMNSEGQQPRMLLGTDENSAFSMLVWSPDGRRLAYIKDHNASGTNEASIESFDLKTSVSTTLVAPAVLRDFSRLPPTLRSLVWLPDGRFVYSSGTEDISGYSCNYWQLQVDNNTGLPAGTPKPLTNWAGFCIVDVGATADGKKLVFQRVSDRLNVFIAPLDTSGNLTATPMQLTDQQAREYPTAWTADAKTVIFASNRNGHWEIFQQKPGNDKAELLSSGLTEVASQTPISGDGVWLYNVSTIGNGSGARQISRIAIAGGSPEPVLAGAISGVRCSRPPAGMCAFAEETSDRRQLVFTELDPINGRGRELASIDLSDTSAGYEWALSPDGRWIAFAKQFDEMIRLVPVDHQTIRTIRVTGWNHLRNITWAVDGKGFYASHPTKDGAALLQIDLRGRARILWQLKGQNVNLRALPSPDGRQVAILGSASDNNVWKMENF